MFDRAVAGVRRSLHKIKVWVLRGFYRLQAAWNWRGDRSGIPHLDLQVPAGDTAIGARLYPNSLGNNRPLIVYIHGGGWVIGGLASHHPFCRALAHNSRCSVLALDYRLAPEHPFPAAQDDCLHAITWIAAHAARVAPCNGSLVIAGDSAGGNLATCSCLALAPAAREQIVGEILIYPATDHYSSNRPSYVEKATGQMLTTGLMQWFWNTYLAGRSADDAASQRAFPARAANLGTLPPTLLITAENDPLRDEGIAYAEQLQTAGVSVHYHHFAEADHGFACGHGPDGNFRAFIGQVDNWLQQLTPNN